MLPPGGSFIDSSCPLVPITPDLDAPAPDEVVAVAAPPCPETALSSPLPTAAEDDPPADPLFPLPLPDAPPAADAPPDAPAFPCDEVAMRNRYQIHYTLTKSI